MMTGMKILKSNRIDLIEKELDRLYSEPKCELLYNNDYELLIAIVLSAQATDKSVNLVTPKLFKKYNSLEKLKDADINSIIKIIHSIGTYNRKAYYIKEIARILVDDYDSKVPTDRNALESMPGVGRKVANVFLSEYYNIPNIAVDTHVERVSKRLGLAKSNDSLLKVEKKLEKAFKKDTWCKRHLQLVLFGRYQCKSIRPQCYNCNLKDICKYKEKK